jgi:hypothetical protein
MDEVDQDDRRVSVYLTPEEKETIRRLAFAEKMTPSKYVRKMLLEQTDLQKHVASFFGQSAAQSTHFEGNGTQA